MAYQVKQRDPLFDADTQAMLEKRGRELLGVVLVALGGLCAMLLATYSPSDPSWISATDAPVHNALGGLGAAIASPLHVILGLAAWCIVILFVTWGTRLVLHYLPDRAMGRLVFAPVAMVMGAIYAATLLPHDAWTHSFGLGGLLGDTILGAVLGVLPINAALSLKAMSFVFGIGSLCLLVFSLGFTRPELRSFGRFFVLGLIVAYVAVRSVVVLLLNGLIALFWRLGSSLKARKDTRLSEPETEVPEFMDPQEPSKPGLMARLAGRFASDVEPELVEQPTFESEVSAPSNARISARISDAIKSRTTTDRTAT